MPTHLAFPPLPGHNRGPCRSARATQAAGSNGGQRPGPVANPVVDYSRPARKPSNAELLPEPHRWWMMYRGEVAPRVLWPRHGRAPDATAGPMGCGDDGGFACRQLALGRGCQNATTAASCELSCGSCAPLRALRFALVVFICNGGNDHYGNPPTEQIVRVRPSAPSPPPFPRPARLSFASTMLRPDHRVASAYHELPSPSWRQHTQHTCIARAPGAPASPLTHTAPLTDCDRCHRPRVRREKPRHAPGSGLGRARCESC